MSKFLHEVFVSDAASASTVSKKVKRGLLRKLGSRVYTTNLHEHPEILLRRHAWSLVAELFPGALVVDRTALEHRPAVDGSIFVISSKKRPIVLPGLSIHPRKGPGPLPEDQPFMGGLHVSCPARAYLENMRRSRARKRAVTRTLSRNEMMAQLQSLGMHDLEALKTDARKIASAMGMNKEYQELKALIEKRCSRLRDCPYDPKRLDLFQKLYETLSVKPPVPRTILHSGPALPFFETYFSNFIEGIKFEVDEAAHILFEEKIPQGRLADAQDILGTYQIASDIREMKRIPQTADEFLALLKSRHACLMQGRPSMNPGQFKTLRNRVGTTFFVDPKLVEGTLRQGFQWLQALRSPFHRAVFMMFLVAEVHPFADGNGRCARLMMNAELVAGGQARIIIPTVFKNDYIAALRSLTRHGQAELLIRVLNFAQDYTSRIDWSDMKRAEQMLERTHAFEDAEDAEASDVRLVLPE